MATSQSGRTPSVQRDFQATAGRPSGKRSGIRPSGNGDFFPLIELTSVEEVAGHEHAGHKDKQQAQIQACPVELNREVVRIGIAFHGSDQRRMNCIAARAPRKNTVGIPRVCNASQRTVKIG